MNTAPVSASSPTARPMRLYRGRRTAAAQHLVIVSACDDVPGARRGLLPSRVDLFAHSPAGFEWGFGGAGAAQLALAILADHFERYPADIACASQDLRRLPADGRKFTPADAAAIALHQSFKFRVIAGIPSNAQVWTLTSAHVRSFLARVNDPAANGPAAILADVAPGAGFLAAKAAAPAPAPRPPIVPQLGDEAPSGTAPPLYPGPMPPELAKELIQMWSQQIASVIEAGRKAIGARIAYRLDGLVDTFALTSPRDLARLRSLLGPVGFKALVEGLEEAYGAETLRELFGGWVDVPTFSPGVVEQSLSSFVVAISQKLPRIDFEHIPAASPCKGCPTSRCTDFEDCAQRAPDRVPTPPALQFLESEILAIIDLRHPALLPMLRAVAGDARVREFFAKLERAHGRERLRILFRGWVTPDLTFAPAEACHG